MAGVRESESEVAGVLAIDSTSASEALQVRLWRSMSPLDKVQTVSRLSQEVQALSLAGIRYRHPTATEHECLLRLAVVKLGRDLARRVYPASAALLDT